MGPDPDWPAFDVEGPVRAEIFVLVHDGEQILLTGPCGAAPWLLEAVDAGHPMALVDATVRRVLDDVELVHSTSWRFERDGVILTFTAVIPPSAVGAMEAVPVDRVELARGQATEAPATVGWEAVLEHGLRHLAWLVADDPVVAGTLDEHWRATLSGYRAEPFRQLA
ncbi:MAG TPA: hypothetical protein VGA69_10205 [Nitriliruptorales bacterium]